MLGDDWWDCFSPKLMTNSVKTVCLVYSELMCFSCFAWRVTILICLLASVHHNEIYK